MNNHEWTNTFENDRLIIQGQTTHKGSVGTLITKDVEDWNYGWIRVRNGPIVKYHYKWLIPDPAFERRPTMIDNNEYYVKPILFARKSMAEDVIRELNHIMNLYLVVSVLDYYNIIGEDVCFKDSQYGWTNLDSVTIESDEEEYIIKLPEAKKLNKEEQERSIPKPVKTKRQESDIEKFLNEQIARFEFAKQDAYRERDLAEAVFDTKVELLNRLIDIAYESLEEEAQNRG